VTTGARHLGRVDRAGADEHQVRVGGGLGAGGVRALDDDGQQPLALLAGRLGDELLGPVAEADERAVVDEHELVPAVDGAAAEHGPQDERRPVVGGERRLDGRRLVEQSGEVDAGQDRRAPGRTR
jgi:hypothetical protein